MNQDENLKKKNLNFSCR